MMVMMMAITPSLNASSRLLPISDLLVRHAPCCGAGNPRWTSTLAAVSNSLSGSRCGCLAAARRRGAAQSAQLFQADLDHLADHGRQGFHARNGCHDVLFLGLMGQDHDIGLILA